MPVALSHHCAIRLPIVPGLNARPLSVVKISSTSSLAKSSRTFEVKTSRLDLNFRSSSEGQDNFYSPLNLSLSLQENSQTGCGSLQAKRSVYSRKDYKIHDIS